MVRAALALVGLPLLLAAAACDGGGETTPLTFGPVISKIPWTAPETTTYTIRQGNTEGAATLTLELEGDTLIVRQSFRVPENEIRDEVTAEVDAQTLQPRSVNRLIQAPAGDRICRAEYGRTSATVYQETEQDHRTDEFAVPREAYDSWTDLFLWRTINLRQDHVARYSLVSTCTFRKPGVNQATIQVIGKERVTVPAGVFETWKLEFRSGDARQEAWVTVEPPHLLVRYDNGPQLFELTAVR
jgi:hypothetical protein